MLGGSLGNLHAKWHHNKSINSFRIPSRIAATHGGSTGILPIKLKNCPSARPHRFTDRTAAMRGGCAYRIPIPFIKAVMHGGSTAQSRKRSIKFPFPECAATCPAPQHPDRIKKHSVCLLIIRKARMVRTRDTTIPHQIAHRP